MSRVTVSSSPAALSVGVLVSMCVELVCSRGPAIEDSSCRRDHPVVVGAASSAMACATYSLKASVLRTSGGVGSFATMTLQAEAGEMRDFVHSQW